MTGGWTNEKLGEVLELKRGYDLPKAARRSGKVPIISSSGESGVHDEAKVKGPGVVTGRYGTIGEVYWIKEDFWPLNTTLYVRDFKGNDPRFISYFLRSIDFLRYSDKAAVPGVNRNHLHQAQVRIPPLPEQRTIASILGALDDKIELNRRMNATLESLAAAIFKSWFVDFDPVRAKMDGRQPAGMDEATARLFPDSFCEAHQLGHVPRGWLVDPFSNHVTADRGLSYKGAGLGDVGIPMHNLNSIREGGGYKDVGLKFYSGEFRSKHVVASGDVIVANTEQGFDRLLIGYAAMVPQRFGNEGIFSHHLYRLRPVSNSPITPHFLLHLINTGRWHDWICGFSNGTTVNMLPLDALQKPLLVVPERRLIQKFTDFAASCAARIEQVVTENETLAALRDALLPKLLSGELRVADAERAVEAAV